MGTWRDWPFGEVWTADFEFAVDAGDNPVPVCVVAHELRTGQRVRLWRDELLVLHAPPYAIDKDALFVAFYASAELGCHLALGWPLPANVLDLYVEFRIQSNGLAPPCGSGLLGALAWYGLDAIEASEKDAMRELALRGGPWTDAEKVGLLDYCESDVVALDRLLEAMS
jgi:DNA polymerase-1